MIAWSKVASGRTSIGLDIGAGGFRAAQMRRRHDRYEIKMAIRSDLKTRKSEAESPQFELQRELRMLVRDGGFAGRRVVTSVGAPDVKFHALEIPAAALNDVPGADDLVRFEVSRLMNEAPEQLETRHWSVPETQVPAPNALGIGVSQRAVQQRLDLCDDAGLVCVGIDADAVALHRFGRLMDQFDGAIWGVVDVGESHVRLILCADEVPVLVRSVGTGGSEWTRKIAECLQISEASAEVHKRSHGVVFAGRNALDRVSASDEILALLTNALRPALTELAGEIKRSYEYLLNCYAGRKAGDLILVGGGSLLPNLSDYLTRALGINVRRASSYLDGARCRLRGAESASPMECYALAIGLAL